MASAGAGLIIEPNATGGTGGGAERDPFASPPRKQTKSEPPVPPSARSNKTTGTRYSDAASVRLNFGPSPSRPGEPPPSYTIKYAAPEVLRNGGFQSKSVEKKAMEDAENKLAMLLFDTVFQKRLRGGNAEAKATVENLERLKRGEFKNGNFPKVKPIEPKEFLDIAPVGPPPSLKPLRIRKTSPPYPIYEEEQPETLPKKRKSRKSKKSRKTRKSRTRKH
jgi:hypothetical protein